VKTIGLRQSVRFQRVVSRQHPVVTPVCGSFFVGRTGERIMSEGLSVSAKFTDGSISPVSQDEPGPGQRDIFGLSADPQGDYSAITLRDASLMRTGTDVGHDAVQIQKIIPFSRMTI